MKTVKKPTKAHKGKKVLKAHQGMAHVPKPTQGQTTGPINNLKKQFEGGQTPAFARDAMRKAQDKLRTRGPIAPRPQRPRIQRDSPLRQPAVVGPPIKRPPRISDGPLDGGGRGTITPRKLTSREKRRQGNRFKSSADEFMRQYAKQRKPRQPRQPRQDRVGMPYVNPAADNFPIGKPNPTIRQIPRVLAQPQMADQRMEQLLRRNKGGAVKKKYAEVKTLKQGGYVSRAKYGSVDNLNKKK